MLMNLIRPHNIDTMKVPRIGCGVEVLGQWWTAWQLSGLCSIWASAVALVLWNNLHRESSKSCPALRCSSQIHSKVPSKAAEPNSHPVQKEGKQTDLFRRIQKSPKNGSPAMAGSLIAWWHVPGSGCVWYFWWKDVKDIMFHHNVSHLNISKLQVFLHVEDLFKRPQRWMFDIIFASHRHPHYGLMVWVFTSYYNRTYFVFVWKMFSWT